MANLCSNFLIIKGNKEEIEKFDCQFKRSHKVYQGGTYPYRENARSEDHLYYNKTEDPSGGKIYEHFIYGEKEQEGYSFSNFIEETKDNFLSGWYNWRKGNWGVSTDCFDISVSGLGAKDTNIEVYYYFNTNWSEPYLVVEEMARQYPKLKFRHEYDESGDQYAGYTEYEQGEQVSDMNVFDLEMDYRKFMKEYLEGEYYTCCECSSILEECEIDDEHGKCPDCGGSSFYGINDELIEDWYNI